MHLAEDYRAGLAQGSHRFGIGRRRPEMIPRRAECPGRQSGDIDHVFDSHRHAVQGPANMTVARFQGAGLGLRQRTLAVGSAPGMNNVVDFIDPCKAGFHQLNRIDIPGDDPTRHIPDPPRVTNVVLSHSTPTPVAVPALPRDRLYL